MKPVNNRELLREFFSRGIKSVLPELLIKKWIRREEARLVIGSEVLDLESFNNLYLFGSGKAATGMAKAIRPLVRDRMRGGMILSHCPEEIEGLTTFQCSHPSPSQPNINATTQLIEQLSSLKPDDFFIYLLSGGSSAMLEKPVNGISLEDLCSVTSLMLAGGLPIEKINLVRKQLSLVKGGKLARTTRARGLVLVISDVIGDDLGVIGSGPFFPDNSLPEEAARVLRGAGLWNKLPKSICRVLTSEQPAAYGSADTTIHHYILGGNNTMLEAVRQAAGEQRIQAKILCRSLTGEAREVAMALVSIAKSLQKEPAPFKLPLLLIFGGEMTVTLSGSGRGGRNQEFCLAALGALADTPGITVLSGGSDGKDGNSQAAGGVIDAISWRLLLDRRFDIEVCLAANDSYHGLRKAGGLIVTGTTGTNVADVTMIMIEEEKK